ncbi:hypothetical protein G7Y79_00024g055830 [Physcia stellaris]|nr:hypothetical protein G7Y79_00024g055830 [Physcia stellaris]
MEQPPRRSHASLKHLTLSPLTPSFPLPSTSPSPPLHTSTSHSYLASPTYPSTPTILSRSSSRTRLRPNNAGPQPLTTSKSSPAFPKASPRPPHHKGASTTQIPTSATLPMSPTPKPDDEESSWLLRTASTLQSQRMEEKGQAWLATRNSSTSLTNIPGGAEDLADDEFSPFSAAYSRPQSPDWPRTPRTARSRAQSRRASRMQSRAGSGVDLRDDGLRALTAADRGGLEGGREGDEDIAGPDFVDPGVYDDEEMEGEEEVDENEMRRVVMGRAKGWIDWAVGWMDLRNEEEIWEGDREDVQDGEKRNVGEGRDIDGTSRGKGRTSSSGGHCNDSKEALISEPPPRDQDAGVLADTKWLLNIASKLIV